MKEIMLKNKINYDSLHFGNDAYKELLITDDNYDIMELSNSYLNWHIYS